MATAFYQPDRSFTLPISSYHSEVRNNRKLYRPDYVDVNYGRQYSNSAKQKFTNLSNVEIERFYDARTTLTRSLTDIKLRQKNDSAILPILNRNKSFNIGKLHRNKIGVQIRNVNNDVKQFRWIPISKLLNYDGTISTGVQYQGSPRQQQQEQYKQQKEMDDMLREQEKRFNEKQRDMEKQLRDQEKDLRQKFIDEEKKLADKEREIERARMELEKQQLEREKENMQKQNFIQKAKMEMRREKQQLAKEEKEQRQNERADAISRQGKMGEEGDDSSRPGSSPPKMKFPRAKTPDLLDEFQKKLLELARIKEERKEIELVRDDLIRKAHSVQAKAAQKRAQARDNWKKQYFEEKKKTLPLEEHALKLRREVDNLNRRVITRLEKEADAQQDHNQQLSSQHKIVFMKLQYELDDTKQKIDEMQLKLLGEIKRRIQCKREIVCLHKELKQTRVTANLEPVHSPPAQDQQTDENNTT